MCQHTPRCDFTKPDDKLTSVEIRCLMQKIKTRAADAAEADRVFAETTASIFEALRAAEDARDLAYAAAGCSPANSPLNQIARITQRSARCQSDINAAQAAADRLPGPGTAK